MTDPKSSKDFLPNSGQWNRLKWIAGRITAGKITFSNLSLGAALLSFDAIYAWHIERNRIPRIVKAFERGSKDLTVIDDNEEYFGRAELEEQLKSIIRPPLAGSFNLITGEHGTGKSTSVRKVCRGLKSGVIYAFIMPQDVESNTVYKYLGSLLDIDFERRGPFWSRIRDRFIGPSMVEEKPSISTVADDLIAAADLYNKKHGKAASLVIDNFTELAIADNADFRILVKLAKYEADQGSLVVTFVANEGDTTRRLTSMSESSRLGEVFEVGDLSDEEAIKYMTKRLEKSELKGKQEMISQEVVSIAGGRMQLLQDSLSKLAKNKTTEQIRRGMISAAKKKLRDMDIWLPEPTEPLTSRHIKAWNSIIRILDTPKGEESSETFMTKIGDRILQDSLLSGNVFSYHPSRETVGIQSRPMSITLSEIIGHRGSSQRTSFVSRLQSTTKL